MDKGIIKIHGKDYKTVNLRVQEFRDSHDQKLGIETEILSNADLVVIKAAIKNAEGFVIATGHAEEIRGSTNINTTSALENCETSAIGRALACMGYGGTEYASANEVSDAIIQQAEIKAKKVVSDFFVHYNKVVLDNIDALISVKTELANQLVESAAAAWNDISNEDKKTVFGLATTKGGFFTTEERGIIRESNLFVMEAP